MRKPVIQGLIAYLLLGLLLLWLGLSHERTPGQHEASNAKLDAELKKTDIQGYQRAYQPRPFVFPADHGPHPGFRTEWWYVTGNLSDRQGREFGYQLTLFRIALSPLPPVADSAWRSNQIYMGHFAVTDVAAGRHLAFERYSRAALGLAGAQSVPFRVWLENWSMTGSGNDAFPLRVQAQTQGVSLDVTLVPRKPVVLQGDCGLSQKSSEPGNASYYYSYTRLETQGTLRIDDQRFTVHGNSWLDREWSTSALGPEQTGWDWFALQLNDGHDLMFYRLRRHDGETDPHSSGTWVEPNGSTRRLGASEVELTVLETWTSPHSGDRYPSRWALRIPDYQLALTITPKLADQEMRLQVRYWEGTVSVAGQLEGKPISGQGYLEMTRRPRR